MGSTQEKKSGVAEQGAKAKPGGGRERELRKLWNW